MEHTLLLRIMKMLMLQQLLTLLIICNWFLLASGQTLPTPRSVSDIANPLNDPEKCGQKGRSHICNPDGIIPIEQVAQLNHIISSIHNDTICTSCPTSCRSGYVLGIAVIEAMKLDQSIHKLHATGEDQAKYMDAVLKEAKHYALKLLHDWKMGHCNEDVLIFFSKNDSVLYTVTNSEAQKKLTDEVVGEIAMHSRIKFSNQGNITEGFKEILNNYKLVFLNNYKSKSFWEIEPAQSPQISGSKADCLRNHYTTLLLLFSAAIVWKLAT